MTLHHASLETRRDDVPAELRFWSILDFQELQPPGDLEERATWVARGASQIHLLHAEEPVVMPLGHVAIVCQDYADVLEALVAAGHAVEERDQHWGAPRCYVRSPAGHRVEVMAFPPPTAG
jgi:catechol 2,3-dioxygenase-like lactoylglutathione lyase family enzyme